ncbi:hypothetical protein BKA70DRAFT_1269689 [Coprinopsis sp. MPI-PUGE-AT-0042]|nr:hypothetical protein BKA70DRAFT_1269689 [Coprinopsis sp. MPI-PUGE-AT-0042]
MASLLPFHTAILSLLSDPLTSDLLVLARGLGLRRIVCTFLQIYDSPKNLVLLVNATPEEETAIGEELGLMGCRRPGLRVVTHETPKNRRQDVYKSGGIISVTSRILVVDMLQDDIPVSLVSGIMVLHAEKVTRVSLEAFVIRLFREKNKEGFVKAFTDQPEHITSGLSPLKSIMKELHLRRVHIFPRFHQDIKQSLERRRADVIELSQAMSEPMQEINNAIIQCMVATLSDLKRANTSIDLEDLTPSNAYFRSFDLIVRRQLDPVWHKVGPRTKQLVNDLGVLRRLLVYLLTYDALQFHAYLETLLLANTVTQSGAQRVNHSPWMMTDAANIVFEQARRRCFVYTSVKISDLPKPKPAQTEVIDLVDDEDAWEALDDIEIVSVGPRTGSSAKGKGKEKEHELTVTVKAEEEERPRWLPPGMEPILEEQPKWDLLTEVLQEIEEEILRGESDRRKPGFPQIGSNTVLVMTSSSRSSQLISEYLSTADLNQGKGKKGRSMMMQKLRVWLWWKSMREKEDSKDKAGSSKNHTYGPIGQKNGASGGSNSNTGLSEALQRKDAQQADRNKSRRRVRGGAPAATGSRDGASAGGNLEKKELDEKELEQFWLTQTNPLDLDPSSTSEATLIDLVTNESLSDFNAQQTSHLLQEYEELYGLVPAEETILVRAFSDDSDDRMLSEIQPRFIVMTEPNMEFIRRVEVYRSSNPGLAVRVYHMVYGNSCEEHKYLAGIRKEKESFERLIKERANMLLPIYEERREGAGRNDDAIKTISTRYAGGRRELNTEPSTVIVDMREFRSTLPSLLHASDIRVVPATLTVGDYILTPDMCVERKSLSDLVASFNSGRLYAQCEVMSVHYTYPILLIEFEEDKAFSLDLVSDLKSYAKPTGKYPPKKAGNSSGPKENESPYSSISIQSKLVLLTLQFPRLRIIWSSSPFATSEIFADLKRNHAEPDAVTAIRVGADADDPELGAGINQAAEELLRALPGVTSKNVKYVMGKVGSIKELCELDMRGVQRILGDEPGKACWEFMHKGDRGGAK